MTRPGESDRSVIPVEELVPGMALEVLPDVFWEVVAVEECGYYFNIDLVHGRNRHLDSDATVVVLR